MKKIIIIILCVLFALTIMASSYSEETENETKNEILGYSIEYFEIQAKCLIEYERIVNSFETDDKGNTVYPDWYAGAFMDHEKGQIVIYTTDFTELKCLQQLSVNEELIRYEYRPHSRNELDRVVSKISGLIDELKQKDIIIYGVYTDEVESAVHITIEKIEGNTHSLLSSLLDCDFLIIEQGEEEQEEVNIGGGYPLNNGTLGFAASRNGVNGYVISGHVGHPNGTLLYYSGTSIGGVQYNSYYNGSTADAAFVLSNGNFGRTSAVYTGGRIISASTVALPTGTTVVKSGKATGQTVGSITSINQTSTSNGISFYNQTRTNYSSDNGDSGGPVMVYYGISNGQTLYKLVGIHRSSTDSYAVFSPYANIWNEIGAVVYIE